EGVEDIGDLLGRRCEPAERASARHGADEDPLVEGDVVHPDTVAEERAAGEGRGWVDGDDGDGLAAGAEGAGERGGQRRLPRARRAGQADAVCLSERRMELVEDLLKPGAFVLDDADDAGGSEPLVCAEIGEMLLLRFVQFAACHVPKVVACLWPVKRSMLCAAPAGRRSHDRPGRCAYFSR